MSEFKHTPGPWVFRTDGSIRESIAYTPMAWMWINPANPAANGKLMAAAPDLLEALSFCVSVIKSNGVFERSEELAIEKATTAIEKATR